MKSPNAFLGVALMFLCFAIAILVGSWNEVSVAAKIGLFACGFGCGMATGQWLAPRLKR